MKPNNNFLIALLQNCAKHIEFMKRQQWTITYYCLLLYVAIFGICRYIKELTSLEKVIVFLPGILICVASCYFIILFRDSIAEHRRIVSRIYKLHELECKEVGINSNESEYRDTGIFVTLLATIIVGLLALGWLIFRSVILPVSK